MKKLLAFILIAIFLYNQMGYFIAFKIKQYEVRREIKARIKSSVPQSELTVIRIESGKENKLQWIKENKEFRYNGNMYDVVRKEMAAGAVIYHCINDVQEKQLFNDLNEHVSNHMNDQPVNEKNTIKTVTKDYFSEKIILLPVHGHISFIRYPRAEEAAHSRFISALVLPPELS